MSVVTFLMAEVASAGRLRRGSAEAPAAILRQAELVKEAAERSGGLRSPRYDGPEGHAFVFERPRDALTAALDAQRALAAEPWPGPVAPTVRMAVLSGDADVLADGSHAGPAPTRCAQLCARAYGGQVLVSNATAELTRDAMPAEISLIPLGSVSLPGLERPERVHELSHRDLPLSLDRPARLRSQAPLPVGWPTNLVGRERERAQLAGLLDGERLVTITGAGGAGKTRLAHAVASDVGDRFEDGVVWVDLTRVASGDDVPSAIASACGVAEAVGRPVLSVLAARLAGAELLLVLDNCEHVLEASSQAVDAVVGAAPALRLLATAREPLGLAGEVVWRIPSLSLPARGETAPATVAESDSARLFVERGRSASREFSLEDSNAGHVAEICRRLDGLPLALELAAARLRTVSIQRLAEGLDDRFRLLSGGSRGTVERQRTLLASVEWSHDLLDDDERTLFRRLAVFAAPFSEEAAEATCGGAGLDRFEVFGLLIRLVDKSLVQQAGDRYRLLETLRQFALAKASEAGELAWLRDRHLVWMRRRSESWALNRRHLTDGTLCEIEAEHPDLLAALDWSVGRGAPEISLLRPLGQLWLVRVRIEEAEAVSGRVLACFAPGSPAWFDALAPMCMGLFLAGSADWIPPALDVSRDSDASIPIQVSNLLQLMSTVGGNFFVGSGVRSAQRAIEASREAGDEIEEVSASVNLLMAASQTGLLAEARRTASWLDRRLPKDAAMSAIVDLGKAIVALNAGDLPTARTRNATVAGGLVHQKGAAGQLAIVSLWLRDLRLADQAVAVLDGAGSLGVFEGFRGLARAVRALLREEPQEALEALRESCGHTALGAVQHSHVHLAEVAVSLGDLQEARRVLGDLEQHLDRESYPLMAAWLDLARSAVAFADQRPGEGESLAREALAVSREHGLELSRLVALETLAVCTANAGRQEDAARLFGACADFRRRSGCAFRHAHREHAVQEVVASLDRTHLAEGFAMSLEDATELVTRGRGKRGRPTMGWESLTPAETRVVDLVAQGLPNKQIARKLFVSVATVKTHLVHIYGKLDVGSRTELASKATLRSAG